MKRQNRSGFAVLIDPDKVAPADMIHLAKLCNDAAVDYVLAILLNTGPATSAP